MGCNRRRCESVGGFWFWQLLTWGLMVTMGIGRWVAEWRRDVAATSRSMGSGKPDSRRMSEPASNSLERVKCRATPARQIGGRRYKEGRRANPRKVSRRRPIGARRKIRPSMRARGQGQQWHGGQKWKCTKTQVLQSKPRAHKARAKAEEFGVRPQRKRVAWAMAVVFVVLGGLGGCWRQEGYRIGEASHPGPVLRTVPDLRPQVISHHPGNATGLNRVLAPGANASGVRRDLQKAGPDEFALVMDTVNGTGIGPICEFLKSTGAHVVCAQETWVVESEVAKWAGWAHRRGWKSLWAPAKRSKEAKKGAAGGVALFVRKELGLRHPGRMGYIWHEARAVAGVVEAPGMRPMVVVSAYGKSGGWNSTTENLLDTIAESFRGQEDVELLTIGGDFNCPPENLSQASALDVMDAVVVATQGGEGTFRRKNVTSTLDYFVISSRLAKVVQGIGTFEGSNVKGHVPVRLRFMAQAAAWRGLHLREPPVLPTERVVGPLPPPPRYQAVQGWVDQAMEEGKQGNRPKLQACLDKAYKKWADLAEEEIATATGTEIWPWGLRGGMPRVVWRSLLPEVQKGKGKKLMSSSAWWQECLSILRDMLAKVGDELHGESSAINFEVSQGRSELAANAAREAAADTLETIKGAAKKLKASDGHGSKNEVLIRRIYAVFENESWAKLQGGGHNIARKRLGEDLEDLIVESEAALAKQLRQDKEEGWQQWKDWVTHRIKQGARNAHRYLRGEAGWVPTVALVSEEELDNGTRLDEDNRNEVEANAKNCEVSSKKVVSATPAALLEAQLKKAAKAWDATECPFDYTWEGCKSKHSGEEGMPKLSAERLKEAAKKFGSSTASTYDGFHVAHFKLLGDEALETLASILGVVEEHGSWPSQTRLVVMPLLPKAKGGFRTIGLLPAIQRLWAKARRVEAEEWEQRFVRPYFAAGNGPIDTVWRQACRQEAGTASGQEAAIVMEDLEAFYENIDREILAREAERTGFPMGIVRACLAAYSGPRMLTSQGMLTRAVFPRKGIIAGCSLATTLIRVYMVNAMDEALTRLPQGVNTDVFIDDLALSVEGSKEEVTQKAVAAREIMSEVFTGRLNCKFAGEKTAIVASNRKVANRIAEELGVEGSATGIATNLGIDATAAGRSGAGRRGTALGRREQRIRRRKWKLKVLRKAAAAFACRIFVAGPLPAATFGAEVWGLNEGSVKSLRQTAGAACKPGGRIRSLTAALLLEGGPTAPIEVAPLVQLSRMVWKGCTVREEAERSKCGITTINGWWDDCQGYIGNILRGVGPDGRTSARDWRRIRGPLAAAALSACRIGWHLRSPIVLVDDRGVELHLTAAAPSLIKSLLVGGVKRAMERDLATKWAKTDPNLAGRRICFDVARQVVKTGKGLTAKQRGALRASTCRGVMTNQRAHEHGYEAENKCPMCGASGDSVRHRTFECPWTHSEVAKVIPKWLHKEGQEASDDNLFWSTAAFPHPGDVAAQPARGGDVSGEIFVEGKWVEADGWGIGWATPFEGWLYGDGSCSGSPIAELRRAASAVVQVDDEGRPMKRITAVVPSSLPQTAQASEYIAGALAVRFAIGAFRYTGDCKGVVADLQRPTASMLHPKRKHAGLLLDTLSDPWRRQQMREVKWMPSHRQLSADATLEERRDNAGNDLADEAAKAAVARHPDSRVEDQATINHYVKRAKLVARAIAVAMAMWPPRKERLVRKSLERRSEEGSSETPHKWAYVDGMWRCGACGTWRKESPSTKAGGGGQCAGWGGKAKVQQAVRLGHKLSRAEGDHGLVFCTRCGAFSTRRARKLLRRCTGATDAGRQALRRIEQGFVPWQSRKSKGHGGVRAKLKCVSTFDELEGRWRYRGDTKRLAKTPRLAVQPHEELDLSAQMLADNWPSQGDVVEAEIANLPMDLGSCDEFEGEMEAARYLGNVDPISPHDKEEEPVVKRARLSEGGEGGTSSGGVGGVDVQPHGEERGPNKKKWSAVAKAKEEAKKHEEQAISEIGKQLAAVPSLAKQRMEALLQRVRAASASQEGHAPLIPPKGSSGNERSFRVRVAPSDGHCLYHAMAHGVQGGAAWRLWSVASARAMRVRIAQYMLDHPDADLGGASLRQWVREETGKSIRTYATEMKKRGWGGAVEVAVAAHVHQRCFVIFRRADHGEDSAASEARLGDGTRLRRMVAFNEGAAGEEIALVFEGGNHYNSLIASRDETPLASGAAAARSPERARNAMSANEGAAKGNIATMGRIGYTDDPREGGPPCLGGRGAQASSSSSTVPWQRHNDGSRWRQEGHGRWMRPAVSAAPCANAAMAQDRCMPSKGLDADQPTERAPRAHGGEDYREKRSGDTAFGGEPEECKRRRIRGKCKPVPLSA